MLIFKRFRSCWKQWENVFEDDARHVGADYVHSPVVEFDQFLGLFGLAVGLEPEGLRIKLQNMVELTRGALREESRRVFHGSHFCWAWVGATADRGRPGRFHYTPVFVRSPPRANLLDDGKDVRVATLPRVICVCVSPRGGSTESGLRRTVTHTHKHRQPHKRLAPAH